MKIQFVECQKTDMVNANADILALLDEFRKSGKDCVRLLGYPHKNARSCCNSIQGAIRRYRIKTVKCSMRGENVYLIKVEI